MGKGDSGNAWAQPTPFSSDYALGLGAVSLQDWLVPCLCTGTGGLENRTEQRSHTRARISPVPCHVALVEVCGRAGLLFGI